MTLSEAKRAADLRWQRKNTHIFSVKMRNQDADAFRAACQRRGVTPHSVFLRAAREMIAEEAGSAEPEEPSGAVAVDPSSDGAAEP